MDKPENPCRSAIAAMEFQLTDLEGAIAALNVIAENMGRGEMPTAVYYLTSAAAGHLKELLQLWEIAFKASLPNNQPTA